MITWLGRLLHGPSILPSSRVSRNSFSRRLTDSQLRAYLHQRRHAREGTTTATALDSQLAEIIFDSQQFRQLLENEGYTWTGSNCASDNQDTTSSHNDHNEGST